MKAWLLTNSFLVTDKFRNIYDLLVSSAEKYGITLLPVKYSDIINLTELPDFALDWDKDFYMTELLEQKGLRVFNTSLAGRICDDKALTYLCLREHGIPVPATYIAPKAYNTTGYTDFDFLSEAGKQIGYPMIIKEVSGSFGKQIYMARDRNEAIEIIRKISPGSFVMQQYIEESCGTDIRINIVGGKFVSAIKRTNAHDFRSNITLGGTAEKYTPTDQEILLAVRATDAAGCDFAGVDILKGGLVCEVNSSPHFKSSDDINVTSVADRIFEYTGEKTLWRP